MPRGKKKNYREACQAEDQTGNEEVLFLQYSWRILNAEESTQNEAEGEGEPLAPCLKDLRAPIRNLFSKKRSFEKTLMLGKIESKRRRG